VLVIEGDERVAYVMTSTTLRQSMNLELHC